MSRQAEGWKLRGEPDDIKTVRFRHQGRRRELSTGQRDPRAAAAEAARIYAEVISGRWQPEAIVPARPGQTLEPLGALWLADARAELDETTADTYEGYFGTHWVPFFETIDRMVTPSFNDYIRARLRKVKRKTLLKELSAMRGFLAWCEDKGTIAKAPEVPAPSPKATGTPDARPHKSAPIELAEHDVDAFVQCLPAWSKGKNGKRQFMVRAALEFQYETGLRPETVSEVAWEDRMGSGLRIRDEVDKARYGRQVPLSARARAILDEIHTPGAKGAIFGHHDYRPYIREACVLAKLPRISPYDLRHARGTHLTEASGGNLPGVAYLLGHKNVTTTNRYIHPHHKAAERVLLAAGGEAFGGPSGGNDGDPNARNSKSPVRKGGLEPPRELPHWNLNGRDRLLSSRNDTNGVRTGAHENAGQKTLSGGSPPNRSAVRRLFKESVRLAQSDEPDAELRARGNLLTLTRLLPRTAAVSSPAKRRGSR